MLEHERANLLMVDALGLHCCSAWNRTGGQLSRAKQLGQANRIAPVGLHPFTSLPSD